MAAVETQLRMILGNGQPGLLSELERRLSEELEETKRVSTAQHGELKTLVMKAAFILGALLLLSGNWTVIRFILDAVSKGIPK